MQSPPEKPNLKFIFKLKKKEKENLETSLADCSDHSGPEPFSTSSIKGEPQETKEVNDRCNENTSQPLTTDEPNSDSSKQMVVYEYDPLTNGQGGIVPTPEANESRSRHLLRNCSTHSSRTQPSVGAFTVQCAGCFKWRLIPTKEKYEEIREHILENPFYCETAREWRPDITCDDPEDISQDGSRVWAIDKPNIAQPPPGWQRLLRIRGEGGTKFADVYYVAPSGKRLRSMVEVQKYLAEHPQYVADGVQMQQFSFQIPRPLQENYVKKRPARLPPVSDDAYKSLEPRAVKPLAWAEPQEDFTELQLGMPGLSYSPPSFGNTNVDMLIRPKKKKKKLVQHNFGLN